MKPQRIGDFRVDRVLESEGPYFALDFLLRAPRPISSPPTPIG